jgi:hypothetical protein
MSLATVNDHILFPTRINWRELPSGARSWETAIETTVSGKEERATFRSAARERFFYLIDAADLKENTLLQERILAAMKSGKAACPLWGRGSVLGSTLVDTGTFVPGEWEWQVGDYIFLQHPTQLGEDNWEVRQIVLLEGDYFELDQSSSLELPAGTIVWPIFFGRLQVGNLGAVTSHRGSVTLAFLESADVAGGFVGDCSAASGVYAVEAWLDQNTCGQTVLRWSRSINATSYKVKKATVSGGPYATIATVSGTSHVVERPLFLPDYYVVVATRGDTEAAASNEVVAPPITVEALMRVTQERYRQGRAWKIDPADLYWWRVAGARCRQPHPMDRRHVQRRLGEQIFDR